MHIFQYVPLFSECRKCLETALQLPQKKIGNRMTVYQLLVVSPVQAAQFRAVS
ncbi:hypothetical protein C1H46_015470 [Malus baccata]|uniref:Uncharacterized protein n=1 Tax=Malus baccata TaxID=106549 RepID=A0A540MJ62_MALBA|nr:hypothetical protein C1H46_015470 [Malus baccata]